MRLMDNDISAVHGGIGLLLSTLPQLTGMLQGQSNSLDSDTLVL